jgi:hypothetical protein
MATFTMLTDELIVSKIRNAKRRVVYIAPGIWSSTAAQAIIEYRKLNINAALDIIVDPDPQVFRLGYGDLEAIKNLEAKSISLRKCKGIRIGLLITDDEAWFYTPTPQLIEQEKTVRSEFVPNSIVFGIEEANHILRSIAPQLMFEEESEMNAASRKQLVIDVPLSEITSEPLLIGDIENIEESLVECPPQQFDLARQVTVYSNYIQFVELSLEGTHLSRHTISIPQELMNLTRDKKDQDRLKASYQLIRSDGDISGKVINEKVRVLREKYLKSLGNNYGNVILKQHKNEFIKDIKELEKELDKFKNSSLKKLEEEFKSCKSNLLSILKPVIKANPPDELKFGTNTSKPDAAAVIAYLKIKLDHVIPKADTFLNEMSIRYQFKDVTYETLHDESFIKKLHEAFPYANLPQIPINESRAITSK